MLTSEEQELKRVLGNPDNLIVSEEISDILSVDESTRTDVSVKINNRSFVCDAQKIKLHEEVYEFTICVPSLSIEDLLSSEMSIEISVKNLSYRQIVGSPVKWKAGNILTIQSRRIINEAV